MSSGPTNRRRDGRTSGCQQASSVPPARGEAPGILLRLSMPDSLISSEVELPEIEITVRRLGRALVGAEVESAFAPGLVTMKTFEPPLGVLKGRRVTGM